MREKNAANSEYASNMNRRVHAVRALSRTVVHSNSGVERHQTFQAVISAAIFWALVIPASVQQIHIPPCRQCQRRKGATCVIIVHALDDQASGHV